MLHHERTPVGVLFSWWSIAVGRNASFARGKAEALPRLPQGNGRNRKRHFVVEHSGRKERLVRARQIVF